MKARELIGYLMGLILFVILIPLIMWKFSGEVHPNAARLICLGVMAAIGMGLSIWSIIYMKNVGEGNPMDAFNHEVAPRTVNLMTDGPYRMIQVKREEERLKQDFGEAYEEYCRKTSKLIPHIW